MDKIDQGTIAFANRLADAAGAVIRPYFRQRLEVIDKGAHAFDPVTEADRRAEEAMRALIRAERPCDAILGEEHGFEPGTTGRSWVLDPIDGTRAFITGQPLWGTLIALEQNGRRLLGIIDQPVLGERFIGYAGTSEMRSASGIAKLKTRTCARLSEAVVSTTHPWSYFADGERSSFERVAHAARMSRFGGDCYAYAMLAAGHIDIIIEAALQHWDVAALIPVIENAGGLVTDWHGNPVGDGGSIVAAGDARAHAQALRILNT
ncbi:MAG TPA: histidinol-phosphatase [Rhizomicrobium sp.]|nr:histidinol-phosphatase [Rhizomicrobium sp.]